jgi:hypothetical protein
MAGVFQNIDPPPPSPPGELRGEDTLAGWREGWGVNILEVRDSSVLYVCKYFVAYNQRQNDLNINNNIPLTFTILILTKASLSQPVTFRPTRI